MSYKINIMISIYFSFLKYSIILLYLIKLAKSSNSKINFLLKSNPTTTQDVISTSFSCTKNKVYLNSTDKETSSSFALNEGYNNITIIFNGEINSYANLFYHLYFIEEVIILNFDTAKPTSMNSMFKDCGNLKKVDFGNIDTSLVTDMSSLFENCKELIWVDLSNFNTSSLTTMYLMFKSCEAIKVIDASNFDTSKVTSMYDTFGNCKSLVYLNISNFNTSNVKIIRGMFIECSSLKYLDINNFDYTAIKAACSSDENYKFHYFLSQCTILKCVKMHTFYINECLYHHTFDETNSTQNIVLFKEIIK